MRDLTTVLAATSPFWWEALKWGTKTLVDAGQEILGDDVKRQTRKVLKPVLRRLGKPEAEKAFNQAFKEATGEYLGRYGAGERELPQAVVDLLSRAVEKELDEASRDAIQSYLLTDDPRRAPLDRWVQRQLGGESIVTGEGRVFTQEEVTVELDVFFRELRTAFLGHPFFRTDIFQVTNIRLLTQIRDGLIEKKADLEKMEEEYLAYVSRQNEWIELRGIAPRVQGKEVKMRMKDLFVPLQAAPERDIGMKMAGEVLSRVEEALDSGTRPEEALAWVERDLGVDMRDLIGQQEATRAESLVRLVRERLQLHATHEATLMDHLLSMAEVLEEERVVILGDPGTGKSTLLRYAAYAVANGDASLVGETPLHRVPILVRIASFARTRQQEPDLTLLDYARNRLEKDFAPLFAQRLADGLCVLLLDGLDEVADPHQRGQVVGEIEKFIARYPQNRYVVTSRIVGYKKTRLNAEFRHFTLAPLPLGTIAEFVTKWYEAIKRASGADPNPEEPRERAQELTGAISGHPGIQRLATNPLLLTIMALVNWQGRKLPNRRVELYQIACETLIQNWPLHQRGVQLDPEQIMTILAPIAYRIFATQPGQYVGKNELMPLLAAAIREEQGGTASDAKRTAESLLDTVSAQTGIFLERGYDESGQPVYGFLHQTFLEYLAACYLARRWAQDKMPMAGQWHVLGWREVILLMVGEIGVSGRPQATRIMDEILHLDSEYEEWIHRDLLLSATVLADDIRVNPSLAEEIVRELAALWVSAPPSSFRDEVRERLLALRSTVHRRHVELALTNLLSDADPMVTYAVVVLLLDFGLRQSESIRALRDLLGDADRHLRALLLAALSRAPSLDADTVGKLMSLLSSETGDGILGPWDAWGRLAATHPEIMSQLLDLIRAEDPNLRQCVVRAVGASRTPSQDTVEATLVCLDDREASVRGAAADTLGQLGVSDSRTVSALRRRLTDQDPRVRASAARALRDLRASDRETVAALRERMSDKHDFAREAAGLALKQIYEFTPHIVADLRAQLFDSSAYVRSTAVQALTATGASDLKTVSALRDRLFDEHAHIRYRAVRGLMEISDRDPATLLALSRRANDTDTAVRYWVMKALGKAQARDTDSLEAVTQGLADADVLVRRAAAETIAEIGTADANAIGRLRDCLRDQDDSLAAAAAQALVAAARVQSGAVDCLAECLRTDTAHVREKILAAVAREGAPHKAITGVLLDCLAHHQPTVRRLAAESLSRGHTWEPGIVAALQALLHDTEPEVRLAAVNALMLTRACDPATLAALRQALRDPCSRVRMEATTVLGLKRVSDPETVSALRATLADQDASVRREAVSALSLLDASDAETLAALRDLVHDPESHVRITAASALGHLDCSDPDGIAALLALASDEDPRVRDSVTYSLGPATVSRSEVCKALSGLLADESPDVRYSAARALSRFPTLPRETIDALSGLLSDTSMTWPYRRPVCEAAYKAIVSLAEQRDQEPELLDQ